MKQFPNAIFLRNNKTSRQEKEYEFLKRQNIYYTKVSDLTDEELDRGLEILRKSNDDECSKW